MRYIAIIALFLHIMGSNSNVLANSSVEPTQMTEMVVKEIVDAIYVIEGGEAAKKPFGILSVKCDGYWDCREIAENTVRNNWQRWKRNSKGLTYLEYLAHRYAPIGVSNDPTNLNRHWLGNLKAVLARS